MRTVYWLLVLIVAMFGTAFVTQHAASASAAPVAQPAAIEASPVGTVKDVMKGIVDPNAMAIWDAVGAESAAMAGVAPDGAADCGWPAANGLASAAPSVGCRLVKPGPPGERS